MKALISIAALLISTTALADGWECWTNSKDIAEYQRVRIKVYNNVMPEEGTRNVAVLVLSNPAYSEEEGNRTIAEFEAPLLESEESANYSVNVDDRFSSVRDNAKELIAGTELDQLQSIELDINFSYGAPIADGERTGADLTLTKEDGEQIFQKLLCQRHLKN